MKKVLAWMGRHKILTGILAIVILSVAFYDEEAVMNELRVTDPKLAAELQKREKRQALVDEAAQKEREYQQYKEQLDALNCGKVMKRMKEMQRQGQEDQAWLKAAGDEYERKKRDALKRGETADEVWAEIDAMEESIWNTHKAKEAEREAQPGYIPYHALARAATERRCG